MEEIFNKWPNWLRWTLLLPLSLLAGWIAGFVIFSLTSKQAATPDAPIMHLVWFASIVASNYVAFIVLVTLAPKFESFVGYVFLIILLVDVSLMIQHLVQYNDYEGTGRIIGKIVVMFLGWKMMREPVLRLPEVDEEGAST